ncbi:MAG: hypothetical protein J5J00_13055 [Deltaproteobacteria bacterium]|nr:hypothetical protein [Deltaproteobacteria bacterium]
MGFHDFVSEQEAANFAGVSSNTLSRFAEAGYLKVETDQDGLRLYSKGELEELFGISKPARFNGEIEKSVVDMGTTNTESENDPQEKLYSAEVVTNWEDEPVVPKPLEKNPDASERVVDEEYTEVTPSTVTAAPQDSSASSRALSHEHEIELIKLKNVVRLQERLLDMREEELRSLRRECEWLKGRIERYEEKNDRDQLLLLAETQLIRRFVVLQTQKKPSPLRAALEWIGLVEPKKPDLPAINRDIQSS